MSSLVIYVHLLLQLLCNYSLLEIALPQTRMERSKCFANQNSSDSIKAMKRKIKKKCWFMFFFPRPELKVQAQQVEIGIFNCYR